MCRKEINYNKMSQKEREQLQAEFTILSGLNHPNIVGYYHRDHMRESQNLHIYMEYCGGGDLGRYIKDLQKAKKYAEEGFVWTIFSQLLAALYRCHYGVDPPAVGSGKFGFSNAPKPKPPAGHNVILHRDLKPENGRTASHLFLEAISVLTYAVFLGADNSVKLGDFGLSKLMASHDFASTYVGTPFYMSPEICAAERYTMKSDIWSLGCIIYELCTHEPPFNAKTHFQLVQKIKDGKIAPIPNVYSPELMATIKDCLRVNPDRRPDTATLLNNPTVQLMRKEQEVVELGKIAKKRAEDADRKIAKFEAEKTRWRDELDSSLRREWEVKARLEIDRLISAEVEKLQQEFETEVKRQVHIELQARLRGTSSTPNEDEPTITQGRPDFPLSSVGSSNTELNSCTDMSSLSLHDTEPSSPVLDATVMKKFGPSGRTPFSRAQTMYAGNVLTPRDIEMADPSPMSIASLSLSPRRNGGKVPISRNIFAKAEKPLCGLGDKHLANLSLSDSEDEDLDTSPLASPTRGLVPKTGPPVKAISRPPLASYKTAPLQRAKTESQASQRVSTIPSATGTGQMLPPSAPTLRPSASNGALRTASSNTSPNRRLSKIPSSSNLNGTAGTTTSSELASPARKASLKSKISTSDLGKVAMKNNMAAAAGRSAIYQLPARGRSLVELAQARAGGRTLEQQKFSASDENASSTGSRPGSGASGRGFGKKEVPRWDPEVDEMPSPFLVRSKQVGGLGLGMRR